MSSTLIKIGSLNLDPEFEYLYPHGIDCMAILVPSIRHQIPFIIMIVRYDATILIFVTFFMFVVARIIIECAPTSGWFSELMLTLQICLAQKFIRSPKSTSEFIWVSSLLMFAFVAVMIMASFSYKILVEKQYEPEMDTSEQLANSDLNIFMTKLQPEWSVERCDKQTKYFVVKLNESSF